MATIKNMLSKNEASFNTVSSTRVPACPVMMIFFICIFREMMCLVVEKLPPQGGARTTRPQLFAANI